MDTYYSKNETLVMMSGSGPSVFGIFKDEADAESAAKELKAENYECFVCTPEENRP